MPYGEDGGGDEGEEALLGVEKHVRISLHQDQGLSRLALLEGERERQTDVIMAERESTYKKTNFEKREYNQVTRWRFYF